LRDHITDIKFVSSSDIMLTNLNANLNTRDRDACSAVGWYSNLAAAIGLN